MHLDGSRKRLRRQTVSDFGPKLSRFDAFFPLCLSFLFYFIFLENLANHMLVPPIPASNLQPKILDPPLQDPMMEVRGVCFMRQ